MYTLSVNGVGIPFPVGGRKPATVMSSKTSEERPRPLPQTGRHPIRVLATPRIGCRYYRDGGRRTYATKTATAFALFAGNRKTARFVLEGLRQSTQSTYSRADSDVVARRLPPPPAGFAQAPTARADNERTVQSNVFDLFAGHEIDCELKAMSQWLDEHR